MHDRRIAIVGLGYVGFELAAEFAKKINILGFDISKRRIKELRNKNDKNNQVSYVSLNKNVNLELSNKEASLKNRDFYIITVPTPIDSSNKPDMQALKKASKVVGKYLKEGDIVVFESTVYPGATEEVCIPLLEKGSKLRCWKDFNVAYSPERINPGDKNHTLANTPKIVACSDEKALKIVDRVYRLVIKSELIKSNSIKEAEAAKILENVQRDINIALMNECSSIFRKLNIDTLNVIEMASTKWNFMQFKPGLVGGHCIGVDSYYLINRAMKIGCDSKFMKIARDVNENVDARILNDLGEFFKNKKHSIKNKRILVMGMTFKENCPDLRNSKSLRLVEKLRKEGVDVFVCDPHVTTEDASKKNISLVDINSLPQCDAILFLVAHEKFKCIEPSYFIQKISKDGLLLDLKGIFKDSDLNNSRVNLWRP